MKFLLFLQFFIAFLLIAVILLHSPKEQGMGSIGGQAKIFHSENELEKGLDRATAILATSFIALSIIINLIN